MKKIFNLLNLFQRYRRDESSSSEDSDYNEVYVPVKERKKQKLRNILKINQVSVVISSKIILVN